MKLFPGCYVPRVSKVAPTNNGENPNIVGKRSLEVKRKVTQVKVVESFCEKIKEIPYIIEADVFKIFSDNRVHSNLESNLNHMTAKLTSKQLLANF